MEFSHGTFFPLAWMKYAQAVTGHQAQAMTTLERLITLSKQRYSPGLLFSLLICRIGLEGPGLRAIGKAYQERSDFLLFLKVTESMASLRADLRFADLVRRIGLPP